MELKDFTPAQTSMIINPLLSSSKELMKYSFLDLIYRKVLNVYKEWRLPHPRHTTERLYTFVSRGENYDKYTSSTHQNPFTNPFIEDDYEYKIHPLIRMVLRESIRIRRSNFKCQKVYPDLRKRGCFISSFGLKYFDIYIHSSKGFKLKKKFKKILDEAEILLPKYATSNTEKAKEIINTLGSNILLLKCFNDELIEQLKPIFNNISENIESFSDSNFVEEEAVFYYFLDSIDSFDSSFDSFESFESSFDFGDADFGDSGSDFGSGDFGDFGGFDF